MKIGGKVLITKNVNGFLKGEVRYITELAYETSPEHSFNHELVVARKAIYVGDGGGQRLLYSNEYIYVEDLTQEERFAVIKKLAKGGFDS